MAELKPYRGNYYLWKYLPSSAAAAIFMILFLSVTIAHCWRFYRARRWFCVPFVIGGFMEFVGYIVRIAARSRTEKLMPYAIQSSYILLAPVLFAATIYMTLSRIIRTIPNGPAYAPISPRWITRLFVTGDVSTLCLQAGASGLMFNQSTRNFGKGLIIAGLVFQCLLFGVFMAMAILFHKRLRQAWAHLTTSDQSYQQHLYTLYAASSLILLRSVFRLIEYAMGEGGYLLSSEWPLYVFDAVPMLLVMVIFYVRYPGSLNPSASQSQDGDVIGLQKESSQGKC